MIRTTLMGLLGLVAFHGAPVHAQSGYPERAVHIIVNSAPGGGTDITARLIAQQLSKTTGQSFIVENRGGGGGIIGVAAVAHSAPDGYTLLMTQSMLAVMPAVNSNTPYDAIKDFAPITKVAEIPNVLVVHTSVPAGNLSEFLALAKKEPGKLSFGSAGAASSPRMSMELLEYMADVKLLHVPFKGTGPAMTEILAGRLSALFSNLMTAKPFVEAGSLKALAVSGSKRASSMPDVPTIAEAGVPGYSASQWYGMLAPAGTPKEIVDKLNREIVAALRTPDIIKRLAQDNARPIGDSPAEFGEAIKSDLGKWSKIAKAANITMD